MLHQAFSAWLLGFRGHDVIQVYLNSVEERVFRERVSLHFKVGESKSLREREKALQIRGFENEHLIYKKSVQKQNSQH